MVITLRRAVAADVPLLDYWDTKPHVIESGAAEDPCDWAEEIALGDWLLTLIADNDGRPIGVVQILDPARDETQYWGPMGEGFRAIDIWIGEEADLGNGYGTKMMQRALAMCFAHDDVQTVLIDPLASNTKARRFYERIGFNEVGPRTFDGDECFVYEFQREKWEDGN